MSEVKYFLPLKSDRLLDVLRGIAVLMVIMIHLAFTLYNFNKSSSSADELKSITDFARYGSAGPMLFFLISGFLLESLYYKKYSSKVFFKRRLARIYPMWVLFTLVSILSAYTTGFYGDGVKLDSLYNVLIAVLFLGFLGIFIPSTWDFIPGGWSIEGEVVNYLTFPLIRKFSMVTIVVLQSCYAVMVIVFQNINLGEAYAGFLRSSQIISTATFWFILGVIVSRLAMKTLTVTPKLIIAGTLFITINLFLNAPNNISQWQSAVAIIIALALGLLVEKKLNFFAKLISEIGKYSYGIYLIHFIFLTAVANVSVKIFSSISDSNIFITLGLSFACFIVVTVLSFYFAKLVYKYYELPFINKAKK